MTRMNRTVLAVLVGVMLAIPVGLIAGSWGIKSGWALTGITVLIGLIVTLIDREGFYGPREPKRRPSSR